ncbi:MAG: T9SS type A sorting domain-containing protein [Bacteroidetes bacterium]|nr:T9SS type A sorting domain-containing protein [Bacteroidota bacterium]
MRSTKYFFQVLMVILLAHFPIYAQYTGGSANGTSLNELTSSICANPAHFYAYFGGSSDGSGVNTLISATCSTPPGGFAYMGGLGDGASVHTISNTSCGLPPGAYAYTGGSGDGQSVHTLMNQTCPIPPQFYAYFGGEGSGASMDQNRNCAIVLPVADFTATPTTVCVNTDVQFTDLSTAAVAWEWTFTGGTVVAPSTVNSQNPIVRYATAGSYPVTLKALNFDGSDIETKTAYITVGAAATITATTPGARCGVGSVTIGATSGGIVRWYNQATGGTLLGTGATYTTPSISVNTTYYAEAYNGCVASTRTAVSATINTVPTITGTPASRCGAGVVTLSANPSTGTVRWYDAATGGTLLSTGSTYTTPNISTTTTYYAETTSAESCTSARIPVIATINSVPTVTSTTPATRCGAGLATIQATASAGTLNWYAAATGGTALFVGNSFSPNVTGTTTYYVEASNNGCTSARTPVTITVNSVPIITSTTPAARCDSGSVTLQATASSGTLNWYSAATGGTLLGSGNSFTTPSITTSTNYYVESTDGTCTSARTAVLATVNATPSITSTAPSQVCGSGTVTLSAVANVGNLNWYNAATGGSVLGTGNTFTTPSITTTTTFYVEAVNAGCTSVRVPIVATVNTIPTITSTTGAVTCGNTGGTLSATASAGTIYWYSVASGGTAFATGNSIPVSGASQTFYVEAVSNGCTSPRVAVVYMNNPVPSITSVTPGNRCDAGSLTLGATTDSGTIQWYDAPTGGTLLGTGSSFITPVISSTTVYYVQTDNGNCVSARTPVTASILPTAAPLGSSSQSFCAGETVGMLVVTGSNIQWYDAASGGNLIASNTPLVSGSTYYASQTVTSCESPNRLAVSVVLGNCLGNETFDAAQLNLWPNPVVDKLQVSYTENIDQIEVHNMLGQLIMNHSVQAREHRLDFSSYAAGTYLVRIHIQNQIKTYKIIKQ